MADASHSSLDDRGVDVTVGIPTRNRSQQLRRAIASVLGQTYDRFALVVSDNASEDDTADVVASFDDPRLVYRPLGRNVGRVANINRLIRLARTEFIVLLGDDDQLHSEHLELTLDVLKRRPSAGVGHSGCVVVDSDGNTLVPHARLIETRRREVFESGAEFLKRSMRSGWTVCFPSAVYRRAALASGDGLRPEDGVIDDLPLMMRIAAADWGFAYVNRPLAVIGAHTEASSSELGAFTDNGYRSSRAVPDMLYQHRRSFIAEAELPEAEKRRLARLAERTYRRDRLGHLSMRAKGGDGHAAIFRALGREIRRDPRLGVDPLTLRFVIGQLGARRIRDRARAALERGRQG